MMAINYRNHADGDTIELPQDAPYHMQCCDCCLTHTLHTTVDDDGAVREEDDAGTRQIPPGAVVKGAGIEAGQQCTINGAAGHWRAGDDGYLRCVPDDAVGDARPRFMTNDEAAPIRDAAYAQMVAELQDAWRR
jgi:hypothetical protein